MATLGKSSITELELLTPLSIENGGTGYTSLVDLKSALGLDKVQNTAVYKRYLVINDDDWELASTYNTNTNIGPFYAPTTAGTSGQILQSTGATPSWIDPNEITVGTANNLANNNHADTAEFTFRQSGCPQDGTARVKKLKGNSIVYNQLIKHGGIYSSNIGLTTTFDESTNIFTINGTATKDGELYGTMSSGGVLQHLRSRYYYKRCTVLGGSVTSKINVIRYGNKAFSNNKNSSFYVIDGDYSNYEYLLVSFYAGDIFDNYQIRIECFDLLKMFGSVEAIPPAEEDFLKLFPDSYYPYNPGEIKSLTATHIKSVGFNAWDEEWEVGLYSRTTGKKTSDTDSIRSKNKNRCIGGATYYINSTYTQISNQIEFCFYDSDKNFIGYSFGQNTAIKFPDNAAYFVLFVYKYGTTYKNDICINLSNTGYRDGEYEPYVGFTRELPIYKIKDSEGNLLFPDGLCSAGSVYDEITEKKAIKRIGKVDLGTLEWSYNTTFFINPVFVATIKDKGERQNVISTKYTANAPNTPGNNMVDKSIGCNSGKVDNIFIRDSSYTDKASFKESLKDVYLHYVLATPIEVDLDPEVNMDYEVWDFGTEQMVSEGFSTPIRADIVYGFGTMNTIINNTKNIKKLQQDTTIINNDLVNNYTTKAYVDGLIGDINSILESIINS